MSTRTRIKKAPGPENRIQRTPANGDFISNWFTTEAIFFIAINVILVGISTYQTYVGYQADVAGNLLIAVAIAAVSGLLFLALNFEIRKRRKNGEKHSLLILMYTIPFGIAFFGNFNAFYANQTEDVELRNEIRAYRTQLTETKDEALQIIGNSVDINSFTKNYNSHIDQLRIEFNQPPQGWGRNAQDRWEELCQFLNTEGGDIKPRIIEGSRQQVRYDRAIANAEMQYENIINARQESIVGPTNNVNETYQKMIEEIDKNVNHHPPIYTSDMLDKMVEAENSIRSRVSSFVAQDQSALFSSEGLKLSSASEIGTIKHTIYKAFVEKKEPSATFFALFFSLIIDLAALLYVLVFIPFQRDQTAILKRPIGPVQI